MRITEKSCLLSRDTFSDLLITTDSRVWDRLTTKVVVPFVNDSTGTLRTAVSYEQWYPNCGKLNLYLVWGLCKFYTGLDVCVRACAYVCVFVCVYVTNEVLVSNIGVFTLETPLPL